MGSKWENAELVDIHDMCDSTTISSIKCLTIIDDKNNRKQPIVYYKDSFSLRWAHFVLGYGKKQWFSSRVCNTKKFVFWAKTVVAMHS